LLLQFSSMSSVAIESPMERLLESSASRKSLVQVARIVQGCANMSCLPDEDIEVVLVVFHFNIIPLTINFVVVIASMCNRKT